MKIGWITISNENTGSSRFTLQAHKDLVEMGYQSVPISINSYYFPDVLENTDEVMQKIREHSITHLILQKVIGDVAREIVRRCKAKGIRTIFFTGDWHETPMFSECGNVITCSSYIDTKIKALPDVKTSFVWKDYLFKDIYPTKIHTTSSPTLGWFGNWTKLEYLYTFKKFPCPLVSIANSVPSHKIQATHAMGDGTGISWDDDKLIDILLQKVDIVIIPIEVNTPAQRNAAFAKSENRLLLPMALGIPVICTPISSYTEIITHGVNGYLAFDNSHWLPYINILKVADNRHIMGIQGKQFTNIHCKTTILNNLIKYLKDIP